jgi:protein phosphatase
LNIIDSATDLRSAARRLVERANENGGPDNITCVLARWIA